MNNTEASAINGKELDEIIFENPGVQMILILVYSLVFVFCLFGNLTVVLVLSLHWKMRAVTKFCLGNLAFANLCVGVFCVYQNLSLFLMDSWVFGEFLCKMYHFINSLSHTASILILVVVSVERYFVILYPFKCRTVLTVQRLRLIILGVWITSALLCSPRLFYIVTFENMIKGDEGGTSKLEVICVPDTTLFYSKAADLIQFILLFLLPLIIITVLYTKVGIFLRKRAQFTNSFVTATISESQPDVDLHSCSDLSRPSKDIKMNTLGGRSNVRDSEEDQNCISSSNYELQSSSMGATHPQSKKYRQKLKLKKREKSAAHPSRMIRIRFGKKGKDFCGNPCGLFCPRASVTTIRSPHQTAVRMLVMIVVSFAICNLPFHLRKLYQNYGPVDDPEEESDWIELATPITFLLMYSNCAINPILYAFMSKSFRASMKEFFRCKLKMQSQNLERQ